MVIGWSTSTAQLNTECSARADLVVCPVHQQLFYSTDDLVRSVSVPGGRINWTVPVKDGLASNLVVAGDFIVFAHGQDTVSALSRFSGELSWSVRVRARELLADESTIVAQTSDREGAVALDARSGDVRWRRRSSPRTDPAFLHLLTLAGTEILTSRFSLDIRTGEINVRWPLMTNSEVTAAAPAGGVMRVLGTSDGFLLGFTGDPELKWKRRLSPDLAEATVSRIRPAGSGFLVTVRTRLNSIRLHQLSATGTKSVLFHDGAVVGLNGGTPIVISRNRTGVSRVEALDALTGKAVWSFGLPGQTTLMVDDLPCQRDVCYVLVGDAADPEVYRIDPVNRVAEPLMKGTER